MRTGGSERRRTSQMAGLRCSHVFEMYPWLFYLIENWERAGYVRDTYPYPLEYPIRIRAFSEVSG